MSIIDIPGGLFPVSASAGARTSNGAITFDAISLKEVQMVYLTLHFNQAVGHATLISPLVGSVVATTTTALPNVCEIWYGNTTTTSVALAKQTDAVSYAIDVGVTGTVWVIFKIDPALLGNDYDCLGGTVSGGDATNFVSAVWWIQPRYQNAPASNTATRFIAD